jgi:hypothetical protein
MRGAHGFAVSLNLTSVLRICARRAKSFASQVSFGCSWTFSDALLLQAI